MIQRSTHTIDAAGTPFGRLATRTATLLMGKHKPSFLAHIDAGDTVRIKNIGQVKFTGAKTVQKEIISHSWYPGGISRVPLARAWDQNPAQVFRRCVGKMLPRNTHRSARLKRLIIE